MEQQSHLQDGKLPVATAGQLLSRLKSSDSNSKDASGAVVRSQLMSMASQTPLLAQSINPGMDNRATHASVVMSGRGVLDGQQDSVAAAAQRVLQQHERTGMVGQEQQQQGQQSGPGARIAEAADASSGSQVVAHGPLSSQLQQLQGTATDQTIIRHPCLLKGG